MTHMSKKDIRIFIEVVLCIAGLTSIVLKTFCIVSAITVIISLSYFIHDVFKYIKTVDNNINLLRRILPGMIYKK
jgi:hypothetical protein